MDNYFLGMEYFCIMVLLLLLIKGLEDFFHHCSFTKKIHYLSPDKETSLRDLIWLKKLSHLHAYSQTLVQRMNGGSVCVLPVLGQSVSDRERSCSRITLLGPQRGYSYTSLQPAVCLISLYPSILCLYLLSLPSLIVSPHITSLSLIASRFLLPLLPLFSPYLSLYGKAVNCLTPLLHCPSLFSLYLSLSSLSVAV